VAVILNQDLENIGFSGELVIAKPGFARNFLLVASRADIATPKRRAKREAEIAKAAERREKEQATLSDLAQQLQETPLELTLKVGAGDQVFGSVTANDLARQLKETHQLTVKPAQISNVPLKSLGSHTVPVKLGIGVTAEVPVTIKADRLQPEEPEENTEK